MPLVDSAVQVNLWCASQVSVLLSRTTSSVQNRCEDNEANCDKPKSNNVSNHYGKGVIESIYLKHFLSPQFQTQRATNSLCIGLKVNMQRLDRNHVRMQNRRKKHTQRLAISTLSSHTASMGCDNSRVTYLHEQDAHFQGRILHTCEKNDLRRNLQ